MIPLSSHQVFTMERLCRDEDMAQGGGAAMRMSDEDLFLVFASKELVLLVVSTLERSRVAQVPLSMKGLKRRRIQRKMLYLRLLSKGALFSCSNPSSKRGELSTSSALAARFSLVQIHHQKGRTEHVKRFGSGWRRH